MMKHRQRSRVQSHTLYNKLSLKEDDSGDETELNVRNYQFAEPTIEKVIEEGDTLQSLSLRYHCAISEIKRLNNIHRDNEIFAKRTIKMPLRPFSMHIPNVHTSGNATPVDATTIETTNLDPNIFKTKLKDSDGNGLIEVNQIIFNSDVKPIVNKDCDTSFANEISEDEEVHLLQAVSAIPVAESVVTRLSFDGADADISWIALIVCIIIVIFAIPLIYVFYIAEHPELYHHDQNS